MFAREGADVIRGASDAGGSGDAAQAENRRALDGVREGKSVDQTRIYGGAGNASDGSKEKRRHIRGREADGRQRTSDGAFAERHCVLDPGVVGCGKRIQRRIGFEWKNKVAKVDAAVGMQPSEQPLVAESVLPAGEEGLTDLGLRKTVFGEGGADGSDAHEVSVGECNRSKDL